jgi:predicted 2-oxoglutarate/Fe(II)-dependent dioxygenase YbiX
MTLVSIPIRSQATLSCSRRLRPRVLSSSTVAEVRAAAHAAEVTDGTLTDEVQASPMPASTFKPEEDEELAGALMPIHDELELVESLVDR